MLLTPLSQLIQFYLTECEAVGKRPTTVATYRYALADFASVAPEFPADLTRHHCLEWITTMRRRGLREGGIESYQRAAWTFLRWLHRQGYVEVDFSTLPRVRAKDSEIKRPTAQVDEIERMMKVASYEREFGLRNKALVAVFASTGIRRAELAMVDFEDVDMTAGTMYVRFGKGGKQRLIGIGAEARACLWEYFVKKRGMKPGPLFIGRNGVRLSAGAMANVLCDLRRLADCSVTSHQFRRHAAARMLQQQAPIDVVMGQLGHDGPQMSLVYGREGRDSRNIATFHALDQGARRGAR